MTAVLRIEGLARHFGGVMVTNDVSLELFSGDRVALIGPNGAGKTTLVNLISGHLKPNGGSIALEGRDITLMSAARRARLGLARTFQITRLFHSLTVGRERRPADPSKAELEQTALVAADGRARRPAGLRSAAR